VVTNLGLPFEHKHAGVWCNVVGHRGACDAPAHNADVELLHSVSPRYCAHRGIIRGLARDANARVNVVAMGCGETS
jgi:hypothetical protein